MERKLLLSLMVISFLQMSTSLAFCQKGYCKVVGRYFVPKEVKSKQCTFENDFFEDYSIEFYPNCKFKYYSNNPLFGPSQTHGVWSLSESGDTITLDSGRKELSMESMGYFKYPFRRYTFKTLELSKGCVNWYEDGDSYSTCYCFLTICGDTIKLRPNEDGIISISKDTAITCVWAETYFSASNKVCMPTDRELNFFILKHSLSRQFSDEKWVIQDSGLISPVERATKTFADYCLQRDDKWDINTIWSDAWTPTLDMYRGKGCGSRREP